MDSWTVEAGLVAVTAIFFFAVGSLAGYLTGKAHRYVRDAHGRFKSER